MLPLEIENIILQMIYHAKHYENMRPIREHITDLHKTYFFDIIYVISCFQCGMRIKKDTMFMVIEKRSYWDICHNCLHNLKLKHRVN